jgi:predicted transcriptional regulator
MTVSTNKHHTDLQAYKLDQRGLARVFGELEAVLMDAVWCLGEATVAEVCQRLGEEAHYKTVTTVLNRLVTKGALRRQRGVRAFVYRASESRESFEARISREVVESLVRDYGDLAVAQFVDALDAVDPALMAKLEALVRARGQEPLGLPDPEASGA